MGVHQPAPAPPKPRPTKPMSESRRIRKPLMEKKRRERINNCLNDLAAMLTEAHLVKPEAGNKANKLEKADILELTVKHLKSFNKQDIDSTEEDSSPKSAKTSSYLEGFNKCMGVVDKTLSAAGKSDLRDRILSHLNSCKETLEPPNAATNDEAVVKEESNVLPETPEGPHSKNSDDSRVLEIKNTSSVTKLTLVPTRLPSGGVAFLLQGGSIDPELLLPKDNTNNSNSTVVTLGKPLAPVPTCPSPFTYTDTPATPVSSPSPPPSPSSLHSDEEMDTPVPCATMPPSAPASLRDSGEEMDTSEGDSSSDDEEIDVEDIGNIGPYDLSTRRMWRPW